jgi:hypothetical protein
MKVNIEEGSRPVLYGGHRKGFLSQREYLSSEIYHDKSTKSFGHVLISKPRNWTVFLIGCMAETVWNDLVIDNERHLAQ